MTDRVCPGCGKTVLSVATRCPGCGHAFETRYDRHIDAKPLRPRVPGPALIVVAIVVVAAANLLWKSGRGSPQTIRPPAPPPAATVASQSAPIAARSESVTAAPARVDTAPAPKPPAPKVKPPAPAPAVRPAEPVAVAGAQRRFATTWINVREVRSNKSKVVRVLKPGEAVQVDSLGQGWYKVVSGEPGYADRRLLASAPPSSGD